MACTTAYLIRKPEIEEVNEAEKSAFNVKTRKWDKWTEPFLIPQYQVSFQYDFGFCCGVDGHTETFQTKDAAEAAIKVVYNNEHKWIKYNEEYMEDDDDKD